ncbi:MAG: ribose-5-phosphate isomerase RpiA [Archaeoglobaceae archaeon]|nr:ribose-5-phosphate isomerase RpiA [Archaeoglobaceae archaeon]MDW8014034.1 ribose-5-phosphate isomerase RpiA [Archaeoglobaceae archaeon]
MIGKINAAKAALELVKDGMIVGLGSGSTVEIFIEMLAEKVKNGLEVVCVPSSYQSHMLAASLGIKVSDLFTYNELDICVDGADQVDREMNCIKGKGAAMTREKIVAAASRKVVIIVDESKLSEKLNAKVPVEILPFSYKFVLKELERFGKVELRRGTGKLGPVVTDNGNFILDCDFGVIEDAEELETSIKLIPGVVECGILPSKMVDVVIVGSSSGFEIQS